MMPGTSSFLLLSLFPSNMKSKYIIQLQTEHIYTSKQTQNTVYTEHVKHIYICHGNNNTHFTVIIN